MKKRCGFLVLSIFCLSFTLSAECIKGNCYNGFGTYVYANGASYQGNFFQGKMNGDGVLKMSNGSKYLGSWKAGKKQGKGRQVYNEGHEYLGHWINNARNGDGKMAYKNGDIYEGNWRGDRPNGDGNYRFRNGEHYAGNFVEGRFQGKGTMYYNDGTRYVGNWQNNKKHGEGNLFMEDGRAYAGRWNSGRRLNINSTANVSTAIAASPSKPSPSASLDYSQDCNKAFCETGVGTFTYQDGSKYMGSFQGGNPWGEGTVYYANGDVYSGGWQDHAPHGQGVMNYHSGRALGAIWQRGRPIEELYAEDTDVKVDVAVDESAEVKIWAVVVGVGRYAYMPQLKYTDDDAFRFYSFLKSPEGGAIKDEQIKLLVDEYATRENIMSTLRSTLHRADANDVIMFYFSGHGLQGAFLPVDYDGYNNRLAHTDVKQILLESKAKHKMVFGDACHSGTLTAAKGVYKDDLASYYKAFEDTKGGLALMMSSKGEEVSLEDGGLQSGIFSHYLIDGLKGSADLDNDQIVTISELFGYVHYQVLHYTANAQTPTITGDYDHKMPVSMLWR